MSYSRDIPEQFRRTAIYVIRFQKAPNPPTYPLSNPGNLSLVISLKTANKIGDTIPQNVLARADRVIK
jgi:ABC-type uncharacterized transport system substrate-binding protein